MVTGEAGSAWAAAGLTTLAHRTITLAEGVNLANFAFDNPTFKLLLNIFYLYLIYLLLYLF
jgi:hypothetical protein